MTPARNLIAIGTDALPSAFPWTRPPAAPIPAALVTRVPAAPAAGAAQRTKLWEFNTNLHCSIIGTCLSTAELRQVLRRLGLGAPHNTDHELHATAVSLAGRHDKAAKLLHKALDERHRLAVGRFAKARTEDAVRTLWSEAVRRGDIPGAYWATLTHPAATHTLVRDAFGEVHMLSHLVGAANRADIRRLHELESENAALRERNDRQQAALREAVTTRDARIEELRRALARQVAAETAASAPVVDGDSAVLRDLVADRERRLEGAARRRRVLEDALAATRTALQQAQAARAGLERERDALRQELDVVEAALDRDGTGTAPADPGPDLAGMTILYVGGGRSQVAHLRAVVERSGAAFLHHDGGIEQQLSLLAGQASQADLVVFPVDQVSHPAAQAAKQLCRHAGKRLIPLRTASSAALFAALRRPEVAALAKPQG